jgi:cytidine deaminase
MAIAYNAALRSSSLSRVVGAAIMTPVGDIVSVGTNEVPRYGGGEYWAGDRPDGRNFQLGYDPSDRTRREVFADLLKRFNEDRCWAFNAEHNSDDLEAFQRVMAALGMDETIKSALSSEVISKAQLLDVIEYGREVHAEMAAIIGAARRGVSVRGCVLYCTTFPCHECARHIVSAGIARVIYIEPYPKSRVAQLYQDSVGLADTRTELGDRVRFEPFVGISPRRYLDLFSWVPRKVADLESNFQDYTGAAVNWSLANAALRDTIVDTEALESGALAESIQAGEKHATEAFDDRLSDAEKKYAQEESLQSKSGKV